MAHREEAHRRRRSVAEGPSQTEAPTFRDQEEAEAKPFWPVQPYPERFEPSGGALAGYEPVHLVLDIVAWSQIYRFFQDCGHVVLFPRVRALLTHCVYFSIYAQTFVLVFV